MSVEEKQIGFAGRVKSMIVEAAIERVTKKFGIQKSAVRNMKSFIKLLGMDGSAGDTPREFLAPAADMWSGFLLTPFAQQQMQGWVLPYWLAQQSLPSSQSFIPNGHSFLECNITHRNWTGVGLSGFPNEAVVDPRGLVTPWPFAPSVDVWVRVGDQVACPSETDGVKQELEGGIPVVRTTFEAFGLECVITTFVSPLAGIPVTLTSATVSNPGADAVRASLVVSVRPYNPESICAINELSYDAGARTFTANGNVFVYLGQKPSAIMLSDFEHGDVAQQLRDSARERLSEGTTSVAEPIGLSTGAAIFDLDLSGGESVKICFACPLSAETHPPFNRMLPERDSGNIVEKALEEQHANWAELISKGMSINVPDETYQKAFDVNKAFLLLLFDGRSITPGVSTYHMMWFRDAAYLIPALERIGHADMACDILRTYPEKQAADGFFCSQSGEWDSNGQAMYTLINHYRMTGDSSFLKDMYPSLMRGAGWIKETRQLNLPTDDPRRGLLPSGISAEHFGMIDVYYWDDLWTICGLREVAFAARELGFKSDAIFADEIADEMWRALEASWAAVEKRLGRKVLPTAPGRDIDSGSIGVISAIYPLNLMTPQEERMANTLREIIDRCFYRDTFYHGIAHCGLNAYLSLHIAQCLLKSRDRYAFTIFESLMSMATPTYTFPEAINPLTGGGAFGDGHHGWAVCEFINFLRNVMLMEEGDRLAILKLSKPEWFAPGNIIEVKNAATFFGEVSYSVNCANLAATFNLPGSFERPPAAIELNVPFEITSCKVDGRSVKVEPHARSLEVPPDARKVVVKLAR